MSLAANENGQQGQMLDFGQVGTFHDNAMPDNNSYSLTGHNTTAAPMYDEQYQQWSRTQSDPALHHSMMMDPNFIQQPGPTINPMANPPIDASSSYRGMTGLMSSSYHEIGSTTLKHHNHSHNHNKSHDYYNMSHSHSQMVPYIDPSQVYQHSSHRARSQLRSNVNMSRHNTNYLHHNSHPHHSSHYSHYHKYSRHKSRSKSLSNRHPHSGLYKKYDSIFEQALMKHAVKPLNVFHFYKPFQEPTTKPMKHYHELVKGRSRKSAVIEKVFVRHNPPVIGCLLRPFLRIKLNLEDRVIKPVIYDDDCVSVRWYRTIKRLCNLHSCSKPAYMECLTCVLLNLQPTGYCSPEHMKEDFVNHKHDHNRKLHKRLERKRKALEFEETATTKSVENLFPDKKWYHDDEHLVRRRYKLESAAQVNNNYKKKQSSKDLRRKFVKHRLEYWEKIDTKYYTDGINYRPTEDDVGRRLLMELRIKYNKNPLNGVSQLYTYTSEDVRNIFTADTSAVQIFPMPCLARDYKYLKSSSLIPSDDISENGCTKLRVLSYNTLAEIYASQTQYPTVAPHILQFDYRKVQMITSIMKYNPDIICLQEVQLNHFEDYFQPQFYSLGYKGMFEQKKRQRSKHIEMENVDGCATFFKVRKFSCDQHRVIDFNVQSGNYIREQMEKLSLQQLSTGTKSGLKNLAELSYSHSTGDLLGKESSLPQKMQQMSKRLMKGNVCLLLQLKEHGTGRLFCIANVHLFWDPNFADVKLFQSWIMCREVKRYCGDTPYVICGDFNSEPDSEVHHFLLNKKLSEHKYKEVRDKFSQYNILPTRNILRHELKLQSSSVNEINFTNYTEGYKGTLDYIFYGEKMQCLAYLTEYPEKYLAKERSLPNSVLPSDHLLLCAQFVFRREYENWTQMKQHQAQQAQQAQQSQHSNSIVNTTDHDDDNNEGNSSVTKNNANSATTATNASNNSASNSQIAYKT